MDTTASLDNLWPQLESRIPRIVNFVLIFLIAYTLAMLLWGFFDKPGSVAVSSSASTAAPQVKPQRRPDYDRRVAQLHILGVAAKTNNKQKLENAPDTTLNLKLLGVLAGDQEFGYAIISSGGNKVKHYGLGDDVPGGATLHAVYPDRVILDRDIRMETLRLPKSQSKGFSNNKTTARAAVNTVTPPTTPVPPSASGSETLGQLRDVIANNPAKLTEYISASQEKDPESGEFLGIKVTPSKNPDMFYQMGFQPGDLITNINGIELEQQNDAMKAMAALRNANEINMVVMREGTQIQISQDLSQ